MGRGGRQWGQVGLPIALLACLLSPSLPVAAAHLRRAPVDRLSQEGQPAPAQLARGGAGGATAAALAAAESAAATAHRDVHAAKREAHQAAHGQPPSASSGQQQSPPPPPSPPPPVGAPALDVSITVAAGRPEDRHPYEGIGALSAGASSRLLKDYPEKQLGEILDLLFKPNYGASVQVLKVEIGGDMQSTDGSEPSHMHSRDEVPDCTRGYETWLIQEAKKRNPNIRTYGLAWGVPGWIGNGTFFSPDNIRYHLAWLTCIREVTGFEVDYVGIWNEMPWGNVWYVKQLAEEVSRSNLTTKLVLLDAVHGVDSGFLSLFAQDASFRDLVAAVGLHYPCENYQPLSQVLAPHRGTRMWASEELSTVADWGGAGCWGRMINQNFVRMNATSSIAWSLVWSAYPNLECFGNGLLYAFEPWGGHYEVTPPVWTMAHTTQFTEVGWQYLPVGVGSGLLPGGGTFVTIASPDLTEFSIVLETLKGQCFYHSGCYHTQEAQGPQRVRLQLIEGLAERALEHDSLEVWVTTPQEWFRQLPDVAADNTGTIEFTLPVDSIVTITTLRRASRRGRRGGEAAAVGVQRQGRSEGLEEVPAPAAFPLPYRETFDGHGANAREAPYFADQGGAFQMVQAKGPAIGASGDGAKGHGLRPFHAENKVLEQQVLQAPIAWIGHSPEPVTLVGGVNWTDVVVEVEARLGPPPPSPPQAAGGRRHPLSFGHPVLAEDIISNRTAVPEGNLTQLAPRRMGLCARVARYSFFGGPSTPEGYCIRVMQLEQGLTWVLTASGDTVMGGLVEAATASRILENSWVSLRLEAREARIRAWVDGREVASTIDTSLPFGQVALECGYHRCQFDDLKVQPVPPPPRRSASSRYLLRQVMSTSFDYNGRTCDPPPHLAKRRRDFTGFAGFAFAPKKVLALEALGRLIVSGGHPWAHVHNVSLFERPPPNASRELRLVASVALPTAPANQLGIEETEDGWAFASLAQPVTLEAGREYFLVSSELANGDFFYDRSVRAVADESIAPHGPLYVDASGWHLDPESPVLYGPLNARLASASRSPIGASAAGVAGSPAVA